MTRAIGIMQGRLLPPINGRIQAFPADEWRREFELARLAGLACIEWIYEVPCQEANPLMNGGHQTLQEAIARTGVSVSSVCADYFMTRHLVDEAGVWQHDAVAHLQELIVASARVGARYIVLPFVDESSLAEGALGGLSTLLKALAPLASAHGIELHVESDLSPEALASVILAAGAGPIRANYDIGNSASLGHDPVEEFRHIGALLGSVHVKDRVLGGGTVLLGTGSAQLDTAIRLVEQTGFRHPYILQVARDASKPEVEHARSNRLVVESIIDRVHASAS